MGYSLLADAVVIVHFAFIAFVAVGGLIAWRWPLLIWPHLAAVAYALGIVTIGWECPLTPLEKRLRKSAGERGYEGGFVDRYIEDVIYPDEHTWIARSLIVLLVAVGWIGLGLRRRRASARAGQVAVSER